MRIGIDATCWANGRGYGRFTRELVTAMVARGNGHEFVCFLDGRSAVRFDLTGRNVRTVVTERAGSEPRAQRNGYRSPVDMLRQSRAIARESLDVFFAPSIYTFVPLPRRLPAVVTIHDAIPERYPRLTLPTPRARLFWYSKVKLALWQAKLVLTVSDFAAKEIAEVHHVSPSRIRVALEAPSDRYRPSESTSDVDRVARSIGLPPGARWLTYVGGFNPHKNLDVLVRAHRAASERLSSPLYLVLVGGLEDDGYHRDLASLHDAIRACGTADRIIWPGFLSDDAVRHLHSGAVALVLPSANEGFGLPAVEAAACGTPVIATTASPLPQLLEGGGLFVPPGDENALAAAIERLGANESLRRALGTRARKRACELSWNRGAGAALAALEEAVT